MTKNKNRTSRDEHKPLHPVLTRGPKQKLRAQAVIDRYPVDALWLYEDTMTTLIISDALYAKRLDEWVKNDVLPAGTTCVVTTYDDGCMGEAPCPGHPQEIILGGAEHPRFLTRNWLRGHLGHIYIKVEADGMLVYDCWHGGQGHFQGGKR